MPPRTKQQLTAREKREKAVRAKLDGHTLAECAAIAGYSSTGAASQAISEYLRSNPPQDIEAKRDLERMRLERLLLRLVGLQNELLRLLGNRHVVIQHGKVVGRFAGWMTDPENPSQLMRGSDGKPIATVEEIEDDEPAVRIIAELRANVAEQRKVSESLRRLDGLDKPVVIQVEDVTSIDAEIDELMAGLVMNNQGVPERHPG